MKRHRQAVRPPAPAAPSSAPAAGWLRGRLPPHYLAAAGLVLLTLAAYAPVRDAGFIWDDDQHVSESPPLRDLSGLGRIWLEPRATPQYYPLTHTTFWAEYRLWGLNPFGYHLDNVVLHAANALLLWRLLRRLAVPGAFWAAALFAVHPVHVESVAWVSERKNVLSALCYLGSALALLRFWPPEEADPRPAGRWAYFAVALLLFAAALFSKTVACTLPAAFLLVRWWKHGRVSARDLLVSAPLFLLGLALALPTAYLETDHVGARGPEWDLSAVRRVLIAGRALWFYTGHLLWPAKLSFVYPRWQVSAAAGWQYGFPLAALAALLGLYSMRRRWGRGPLTAALFFCGTLVPALGFFNVYPMRYTFVADHYQYLASAGLLALAAAAAAPVLSNRSPGARSAGRAAGVALLGLLAVLTWSRAGVYRDVITLWSDTLAKDPDCWMAYTNRGLAYARDGQLSRALEDSTRAIELTPDQAKARHNRALIYLRLGQPRLAIDDCTRAIGLEPGMAKAYATRGLARLRLGELPEALDDSTRAIELMPDQPGPYCNRGLVYARLGKRGDAEADFTRAILLAPELPEPYSDRGDLYLTLGRPDAAIRDYDRVIELAPQTEDVYSRRGTAEVIAGRLDRAAEDFARALAMRPDAPTAYFGRALLHYANKEYAAAWGDVKRGQELGGTPNPQFLRALSEASDPGQSGGS